MKKVILLLVFVFLITGCGDKNIVGPKWKTNSGSTYEFYEDLTCTKVVNGTNYKCTYEIKGGVVDIKLSNGIMESGQINSSQIVIGSEVYNKGE